MSEVEQTGLGESRVVDHVPTTDPLEQSQTNVLANWPIMPFMTQVAIAVMCIHMGVKISAMSDERAKKSGTKKRHFSVVSKKEAQFMPIAASCTLMILFVAIKFLKPEILSLVVKIYFNASALGTFSQLFATPIENIFPTSGKKLLRLPFGVRIPLSMILGGIAALPLLVVYFVWPHWIISNIIAILFSITAIYLMRVERYKHIALLLSALLVYDVFWVYGTPVMITVATKIDIPIKITIPKSFNPKALCGLFTRHGIELVKQFVRGERDMETSIDDLPPTEQFLHEITSLKLSRPATLGLGDIVLPGIYIATLCRAYASVVDTVETSEKDTEKKSFIHRYPTGYWISLISYFIGISLTGAVLFLSGHGQPALLYIVPALLISTFIYGFIHWGFTNWKDRIWEWSDESVILAQMEEEEEESEKQEQKTSKKTKSPKSKSGPKSKNSNKKLD